MEIPDFETNKIKLVESVYKEVFSETFNKLINDDLLSLVEDIPDIYRGLNLWYELFLFSTASIANSQIRHRKGIKPTEYAKYYLINKYNQSEAEELWDCLKDKLEELVEAREGGKLLDWLSLYANCLNAYTIGRQDFLELIDEVADIIGRVGGERIFSVQVEVANRFTKLWKKI